MPPKKIIRWDEDLAISPIKEMSRVCDTFKRLTRVATPEMVKAQGRSLDASQLAVINAFREAINDYHQAVIDTVEDCRQYLKEGRAYKLCAAMEIKMRANEWERDDRLPFVSQVTIARHSTLRMFYRLDCIRVLTKINTGEYTNIVHVKNNMASARVPSVGKAIVELFHDMQDDDLQFKGLVYLSTFCPDLARKTFSDHSLETLSKRCDRMYEQLCDLHDAERKADNYVKNQKYGENSPSVLADTWKELLDEAMPVFQKMDAEAKETYNMRWNGVNTPLKRMIFDYGFKVHKKIQVAQIGYVFGEFARMCYTLTNPGMVFHRFVNLYMDFSMHKYSKLSGKLNLGMDQYLKHTSTTVMPRQNRLNRIYQDSYNYLVKEAEIKSTELDIIDKVIGWKYIEDPWSILIRPDINTPMIIHLLEIGVSPMKNSGYLCRCVAAMPPDTKIGKYPSTYTFIRAMFETGRADAFDLPCMWINNCMASMNVDLLAYLITPNPFNRNRPWVDPFCNDNMLIRDLLYESDSYMLKGIARQLPKERIEAILEEMDAEAQSVKYSYDITRIAEKEKDPAMASIIQSKQAFLSRSIRQKSDQDGQEERKGGYVMIGDAYAKVLAHRELLRSILPDCVA